MARRGEFDIIADLFAPLVKDTPGALGLKDDAALLDPTPGCQLVITADALISGVHFLPDDPPDLVARKALRVNLSDLAAKGAMPRGFVVTLALDDTIDDVYLAQFAAGLRKDIEDFRMPLLGGDTTAGPGPFTISITALGEVAAGRAVLRGGAKPGDLLYVSGTIGDAALSLACRHQGMALADAHHGFLDGRYRLPLPRLAVGQSLVGLATACLDVSDGLCADVGHICEVSGVGAEIMAGRIPLSDAAKAALTQDAGLLPSVLGGGDDYELAFTVPPKRAEALADIATASGVPLTAIGRMTAGNGVKVLDAKGGVIAVDSPGYRHR